MEIKPYSIADLRTVLSSNDFWLSKTLPITKHRAAAQIHNPRAEEDDIVLLVAYQSDDIAGYLGVLPDRIFISDESYKLGWLTGWWVNPKLASAGLGTALLFKALNAYSQRIGVSGSSKDAGRVLQASRRFVAIDPLRGLEITLDANSDSGKQKHLKFEYLSLIDEETDALIQAHNRQDLTRKEKVDLDWIMTYPWVLSAPQKDIAGKRFYFSSIARRFSYLGVKVFDERRGLIGFFVLKARDDKVSLIFSYFDNEDVDAISDAVLHHALAMEASKLSLYGNRMVDCFPKSGYPVRSTKSVSRGFLLTKPFENKTWAACRLQGGDGDLAFY